ncbi:hypothetical protein [Aeromonas sp. QDB21]|uniref:hypothetical protein n=1 Tax=Aeromonas sp. QDB21 TaxID=2990487 RepID=UPI0022E5EA3B|nr:hypothetical protein [Aeromonas sp. QDB21]
MANVTETPSYDAGIYQIETTDPVLGGPNGIANSQAKGLANRTAFLKQQIDQLNSGQLTPAWIASQSYVQGELQKLDAKQSVRAATVANITLSGVQTIDGVALTVGDRVLVKDQTAAAQNGIYLVAAQSWTRATDADDDAKLTSGARMVVESGSINAGKVWYLATQGVISVGTTALQFSDENPDATESAKGIVQLATAAQAEPATEATASQTAVPSIARVFGVLRSAIANATESLRGTLAIATQSEVDSGGNDAKAVTPKKLRSGVSIITTGTAVAIVLPTWIGRYAIQFGGEIAIAAGATKTVTFPLAWESIGGYRAVCTHNGILTGVNTVLRRINAGQMELSHNYTQQAADIDWIAFGRIA